MRKTLWLAVCLLICVFAFSACDQGDTPPANDDTSSVCQHTFGDWNTTKQATCKDEGELVRVCSKCSAEEKTKLTSISKSMFHWCEKLSSVTIPSGVTRIENYAFYGCDSLTSITIPSKVTYIGDSTFSNKGLKSITIPVSVKTIDRAAFCNCTALTTFNYAGTKSQWNSIAKGNQWADYSAFSKVNCPNGTITI